MNEKCRIKQTRRSDTFLFCFNIRIKFDFLWFFLELTFEKDQKKVERRRRQIHPETTSLCVSVCTASYFWFSSRSHTVLRDLKESNEIYNRRREDKKNFKKHKPFKQVSSDEKEDKLCDSQKLLLGFIRFLNTYIFNSPEKASKRWKEKSITSSTLKFSYVFLFGLLIFSKCCR